MSLLHPDTSGSSPTLLNRLLVDGFATARLDSPETQVLVDLYEESSKFFASSTSAKLRYSVPNRSNGYRQHGCAHSGSPDNPDLNDSFLYWKHKRGGIPNRKEIESFLDSLEAYRAVAAEVARNMIESLRSHYGYPYELPFEDSSVLQVNSFGMPTDQDLLLHSHEDAVLLTVIWASSDGLEAVFGDKAVPIKLDPDELLIMPGSVMTAMTGGEIQPLYHQARNHGLVERKSVMYFVSPNTDAPVEPFVVNDYNRTMNIRSLIINNPQTFGLPEDFLS